MARGIQINRGPNGRSGTQPSVAPEALEKPVVGRGFIRPHRRIELQDLPHDIQLRYWEHKGIGMIRVHSETDSQIALSHLKNLDLIAAFAGSLDPPTLGHEFCVREGLRRDTKKPFDVLVVDSLSKPDVYKLLSLEARVALLMTYFNDEDLQDLRFHITAADLTRDDRRTVLAHLHQAPVEVIKGVRQGTDDSDHTQSLYSLYDLDRHWVLELMEFCAGAKLDTTKFLEFDAPPDLNGISSSFAKRAYSGDDWSAIAANTNETIASALKSIKASMICQASRAVHPSAGIRASQEM